MTITREKLAGLITLLSGIYIGYLGIESLLLVEDTHLTIGSIRALLVIGTYMTFYGTWNLYSNKSKEPKHE